MAITAETVFNGFKKKDDIKTALRSVQLGPNTVVRKVEEMSGDVDRQVLKDLSHCEYFSLQFDESLDVMDVICQDGVPGLYNKRVSTHSFALKGENE
ncbi:hypothetical protein JOB18_028744, partial [Scomber scombrus]